MSRSARPLRVGFLHNAFPILSQTFVNKEMIGLEKHGLPIRIYSLLRPSENETDKSFPVERVTYLLDRLTIWKLLFSHLQLAAVAPLRYFRTAIWAHLHRNKRVSLGALLCAMKRLQQAEKAARQDVRLHFILAAPVAAKIHKDGITFINSHFADAASSFAMLAAKLLGLEYGVTTHAYDIFTPQFLLAEKLGGARFILTCTKHNWEAVRERLGAEIAKKCRVFYHGIDSIQFQRKQRPHNVVPKILALGRLTPKKGFDLLLDACRVLREQQVEFHCTIVGDGPQRRSLEDQIDRLGLNAQVALVGAVQPPQTREFYEEADLFVLPCRITEEGDRDGIPNVIAEAMAMELPVVSTNISGIPELVADGETGLLVPQNDVDALAAAMLRLLKNRDMRLNFGAAGRERVIKNFDSQSCLADLYRFYTSELSR
ncbi:MAG: glycosyltransferase family 4 protein [candidate division KSB1 bacterium]|nr:glycosyltransferase family 4 protein [candidate division KSB1 bacterium]